MSLHVATSCHFYSQSVYSNCRIATGDRSAIGTLMHGALPEIATRSYWWTFSPTSMTITCRQLTTHRLYFYTDVVRTLTAGINSCAPQPHRKNLCKYWSDQEVDVLKSAPTNSSRIWKATAKPRQRPIWSIFDKRRNFCVNWMSRVTWFLPPLTDSASV